MSSPQLPTANRRSSDPFRPWLLALVVLIVWATAALASSRALAEPIASGKTVIKLAHGFDSQLKSNGIGVQAIKPRLAKARVVTLQISAGSLNVLDPDRPTGHLTLRGAIRLHSEDRRILIGELVLDASNDQLRGSVGNRDLVIATTEGFRSALKGTDIAIASDLRLGRQAARLFNTRLRPAEPFVSGQRLGFLSVLATPGSMDASAS